MQFPSKFSKPQQFSSKLGQQFSIAEVAELMGTSQPTIRRWISTGKLRAYRYSERVIRIDEKDLLAMREQIAPTTFEHINGGGAK